MDLVISLLIGFAIGYFSKGVHIQVGQPLDQEAEPNQSYMTPDPVVRDYYDDLERQQR